MSSHSCAVCDDQAECDPIQGRPKGWSGCGASLLELCRECVQTVMIYQCGCKSVAIVRRQKDHAWGNLPMGWVELSSDPYGLYCDRCWSKSSIPPSVSQSIGATKILARWRS